MKWFKQLFKGNAKTMENKTSVKYYTRELGGIVSLTNNAIVHSLDQHGNWFSNQPAISMFIDEPVDFVELTPAEIETIIAERKKPKQDGTNITEKTDLLAQIPQITELIPLLFAVDFLDQASYDSLHIKDFVHITPTLGLIEDYKTMTVMGNCYLVAFTDMNQLEKGPRSTFRTMRPDEYVQRIKDMPFDGIVVNPFDEDNRKIIGKSVVQEAALLQQLENALSDKEKNNISTVKNIIAAAAQQHNNAAAAVENNTRRMTDEELLAIFAEYFAPNTHIYSQPSSPKSIAYFDAIIGAKSEMLNNPSLFSKATKREPSELVDMCNNPIPGITNSLICGLIFCMGKYSVIPSHILCADFAATIPHCIAVYLLVTAQKLPAENRKQTISTGDGVDEQPLNKALSALSVCDPHWRYLLV